jgi:hypothetical protein
MIAERGDLYSPSLLTSQLDSQGWRQEQEILRASLFHRPGEGWLLLFA